MIYLTLDDIAIQTIKLSVQSYNDACVYLDGCLNKIHKQPVLLNKLGLVFYYKVEYDFACRCFYFLLAHHQGQFDGHNNLGLTLNRLGMNEDAVEHYKKALVLNEGHFPARSNLAYALNYFGETGRKEIKDAQQDIAHYIFKESKRYSPKVRLKTKKKLNIGYVSNDLCNHAVGRFMVGLLENHDRKQFDVHIFDNRKNNNDETAEHLKQLDLQWHSINELNAHDACSLIANHKIDILIDLSGHTNGSRPDIFSNRVAPVQITYLGYPNTTGLPLMDFRIGDIFADPSSQDSQNTETMLQLPIPMWNYTPWPGMPSVSASPFTQNGYITFGSANNHAKLQTPWLEVWAKALTALPNTRFSIKSRALRSPKIKRDFLDFFKQRGVVNERIEITPYSPTKAQHWQTLSRFDIAFDSFPYNGTTTSCDLLWLGVPIITRQGNSHVSRTTSSLLNGMNMQSWVANSDQHFIKLCEEKSNDHSTLIECRQELRTRMQNSSIGLSAVFTIEYEKQLKKAWEINSQNTTGNA